MREIDKLVKDILTSDGFVFKKTSWYRTTKDFIQILNFQKSHFSNKFYLNLGIDEIQEGKPWIFQVKIIAKRVKTNI